MNFYNLIKFYLFVSAVVVPLLLYPDSGWAQGKPKVISIAAGVTGGVFYVVGGGMAAIISKYIPGIEATAEVTAGSVDNCKLLGMSKVELALVMSDNAYDAYHGIGHFKGRGKAPLRTLMVLWPPVSHIVTVEGRRIQTAADLKAKRISTGPPGSGSESMALKILEALELDPNKDIRRERLSLSESVGATKDHKIDAFFWTGGLPTGGILDLASSPGFRIKIIPHDDLLEKINLKYGSRYYRLVIPKETYPGMTHHVPVIATGNLLACREEMEDGVAYQIVKAILEQRHDLVVLHKEAEKITLETAPSRSPIPFHPGAIQYYREKRVWRLK